MACFLMASVLLSAALTAAAWALMLSSKNLAVSAAFFLAC
jgi:hypothetical protein